MSEERTQSRQQRTPGGGRWLVWVRLGCVLATAGILYLVLHRLRLPALLDAFQTMHRRWFFGAIVVYGALFLPACMRWHLVLRLNGVAVGPGITAQLCLIGHFFYVALFGAFGGDAARSALYARWHRQPLTAVLATAPLDRLLGFLGLLLFGGCALLMAMVTRGHAQLAPVSWKWQGAWFIAVVAFCIVGWRVLNRARPGSFLNRFAGDVTKGGRLLLRSPRVAVAGVVCGVLVQACLSATLALNLEAVSHSPLPWHDIIWSLPIIALLGSLPVTVAGLGAREGAALLLLGMYGVSSATAVAASLLTLAASLFWAVIGGLLLWMEARKRAGFKRVLLAATDASNA